MSDNGARYDRNAAIAVPEDDVTGQLSSTPSARTSSASLRRRAMLLRLVFDKEPTWLTGTSGARSSWTSR
eukprot:4060444-Heterocapsa_arctica.AAC.1